MATATSATPTNGSHDTTKDQPMRHRKPIPAVTRLPHHTFTPKHCAGTSCVHDHHNDHRPSLGWFRSVFGRAA